LPDIRRRWRRGLSEKRFGDSFVTAIAVCLHDEVVVVVVVVVVVIIVVTAVVVVAVVVVVVIVPPPLCPTTVHFNIADGGYLWTSVETKMPFNNVIRRRHTNATRKSNENVFN